MSNPSLLVYLAGSSLEAEECARDMWRLRESGIVITHDWTHEVLASRKSGIQERDLSDADRLTYASVDLDGVARAHWFWFRLPSKPTRGAWVELGYAIGLRKPVLVSGDRRSSIFTSHADVLFDSHDEAVGWLLRSCPKYTALARQ